MIDRQGSSREQGVGRAAFSPQYIVVFASEIRADDQSFPFVMKAYGPNEGVTAPHGLSQELARSLAGIWYCLHLPNTLSQTVDSPVRTLKASQMLDLPHHILPIPQKLLDPSHIHMWHDAESEFLALVIYPDELDSIAERAIDLGFLLPAIRYSDLSNATLIQHWSALYKYANFDQDPLAQVPKLAHRLDLAATDLGRRWVSRQMLEDSLDEFLTEGSVEDIADSAIGTQIMVATIASLERRGLSEEDARAAFPHEYEKFARSTMFPLAIGLPGVSPRYCKTAYSPELRERIRLLDRHDARDTWAGLDPQKEDDLIERSAIESMVAHRAVAEGAYGLMLPSIPPKAFVALAELEKHFISGENGRTVWRLLDRLNSACSHLWTDSTSASIARASKITAFTNFPIGLIRLPGDTSPLATRVPITYRPILPLTRGLQQEFAYPPGIQIADPIRILIAECIAPADRIGQHSREAWKALIEVATSGPGQEHVQIHFSETLSADRLREEVARNKPTMLLISAHGSLDQDGNHASIMVGNEVCIGPELGPLPPVVALSACHVAPRGNSTISVADMLLREGAMAVLGTQVPIDVRRSTILFGRFVANIVASFSGSDRGLTLLDAWHQTQATNAVNDVLFSGNPTLERWATTNESIHPSVIEEFMLNKSPGRLRKGHIYADTELVLGEIADDRGTGARIRNILSAVRHVPESLFYTFTGRPDRIFLKKVDDAYREIR